MKTAAAFPQTSSHIPAQQQHTQNQLQQSSAFSHQMQQQQQQQQQQHLLQQQHQQRMQQQQAQHAQLHRLSQPHTLSSVHPTQTVTQASTGHGAQASVFPNAEFFQTLQQTAAALPTVLPYDQSQYIGQLMYFPYPTAAAAAANGLFGTASTGDSQQMSACSTTPATQPTLINQVSSNAGQVIGGASLVSATPGGLVTLNPNSGTANQVQNASHLLNPSASMVGLAGSGTSVGSATQALAPLFTTAHFYQQPQQHSQQSNSQIQLQHNLQHHNHPSFSMQHVHPLSSHSAVHAAQQQQPSTATMLLQGPVHPSASQLNMNASPASGNQTQPSTPQRHVANTSTGGGKGTTANGATGNCDLPKVDDPIHSTPSQTPVKQNEQDILNHDPQSHNSSSNLDVSSSSIKRDNNGTGHFVCGVCGREFGMRCRLIAHTRRHTGERPFPCADCGRAFSDRGNLQRHRYTHSSQPRFHCSVCGKSFRQASCLSNHRRFHCAGASGRPCPFCQRSFRSSSSLQMHIRWKHRADAAAAVAAAAAAAVALSASASSTSSISDAFNHLPGLSYVPTATTINGLSTMSLNGVSSSGQLAGVLSQLVTTSSGSPNKRKWRRKPKPKQNAFGKLVVDNSCYGSL